MEKERICSGSQTHYPLKQVGGNILAWACMASSGMGTLIFTDDDHDQHIKAAAK